MLARIAFFLIVAAAATISPATAQADSLPTAETEVVQCPDNNIWDKIPCFS